MNEAEARNALHLSGGMLSRTVAHGSGSRNRDLILLGVILSCVINGDTVSAILRQATWLVVALIVLIVVQVWDGRRRELLPAVQHSSRLHGIEAPEPRSICSGLIVRRP
ncbi:MULTISPECIES: hypothetical protein [Streptomyces]|uniref:hypothetical protein n=1 Tax=Streptomyces TaxID=1883 RepID=UPI0007C74C07|nr:MULTISPECIES: hypothetical protein [Streptomyces]MDI5906709.1 hypothetical protein [Streptomyces sp. 12257]